MSGRHSRNKGARRERQLARRLRPLFPDARRNVTETQVGQQGVDLVGTGNLRIQVKSWKRHCSLTCLDEVATVDGEIALLVSWPDNAEPVVVMRLADLERVLADVGEAWR